MKEQFIAEIEACTTLEEIMAALRKIKTFPHSEWDELMVHIKKATFRIEAAIIDKMKKEYCR